MDVRLARSVRAAAAQKRVSRGKQECKASQTPRKGHLMGMSDRRVHAEETRETIFREAQVNRLHCTGVLR